MKKTTRIFSVLLGFSLLPATLSASAEGEEAPAAETPSAEYNYGLDAEGNAELYDFLISDTFEGDLVIPSEIDGHRVDYVGNACYMEARGITSVTIPAGLTDMGDSVFMGCTALTEFIVEEGNPYYSVTDGGVLMGDDGAFLVAYPAAKADAEYTVPTGVNEIAPGAFSFAQNLDTIRISEGVEFIDNWAFAHSNIKTADIPGTVYQIDDYAFAYCESLHEVNLGSGIEKIYHAAFAFDRALTQITLPPTLTLVGQYAFCGTSLSCITIPRSVEEINYCAFGYDGSYNAIADFTVYGEPYTMAQEYCTAVDTENDYQNNFTFAAVENADVPYELGEGKLLEDASDAADGTDASGESAKTDSASDADSGNKANLTEQIGAGLSGNRRVQLMLGIGGGVLIVLAGILIAVFVRKPKKKKSAAAKPEAENAEDMEQAENAEEEEITEGSPSDEESQDDET